MISTSMENRLYSIINRLYVAMCGCATGILGFFGNVDSNIHLILVLEGGTLGAFIVFAAFCSSLALLAELVRTEIFHKRALKHRHLLFVAVAFCWLCLLFLGVNRVHAGVQMFWIANIWLTVATALVDAHSRGNHGAEYRQVGHH